MAKETFQLQGGAAAIYEAQKVPAIFAPLAGATLDRLEIGPNDRVIDIACGTGIVARTLADRTGRIAHLAGADLNAGMIDIARSLTRDRAELFDWHVADALNLPFADGSFTQTICQQGLQFIPDPGAAIAEMRRLLAPQGRLALTVWAGTSVLFAALARALERHVDARTAKRSLAPFSHDIGDRLPQLLAAAGLSDISVETIEINRKIHDALTGLPKEILGSPVASAVESRGPDVMSAIVEDVMTDCAGCLTGTTLVAPQHASLFTATLRSP